MTDTETEKFDEIVMSPREVVLQPRMEPNESGKLNIKRTILHSLAFLSALAALTYYNIAVPVILKQDLVPINFVFLGFIPRMTFINILMTIDNILAVTLQPFFASLSDKTKSRFGRRIPFVIIGVIGCAVFFGIAPWFQILGAFVGMLFCYNIFMSFYRSPALALVADYTEEKLRSTASGLQQFIANIGTIVAFGTPIIIGFFVSRSMEKTARDVLINRIGFPIISGVMLICLAILVFATKETPTGDSFLKIGKEKIAIDCMSFRVVEGEKVECSEEPGIKKRSAFLKMFTKEYLSLLLLFFAVFFWFAGFGAIEANFSNLGIDFFGLGTDQTSTVGLVYPISMIVAAIPTGIMGRKIGRKLTLYICLIVLIVCTALVAFWIILIKSVIGLAILMGIIGFFWMGIIVNTFPIIWRLCPTDELSTFTGIYYTFNQAAAILGPVVIGIIFDIVQPYWGVSMYKTLYPFVLACLGIAFLFLLFVKGGEAEEEKEAPNITLD